MSNRPDLVREHWKRLRVQAKRDLPWICCRCGQPITEPNGTKANGWTLDHLTPYAVSGGKRPTITDVAPAHKRCNSSHGAALGARLRKAPLRRKIDSQRAPDTAGAPPRLQTAPHPDTVGTYGPEVAELAEAHLGEQLLPWQRLVCDRLLEHNADGDLVWTYLFLSTPRQAGKSWLIRYLSWWRLHQAERFGEKQSVLGTGKDLPILNAVQAPARSWARERSGYVAVDGSGFQRVSTPDGSDWVIKSQQGVYGYSASLAIVDEGWGVKRATVDEGVEPTLLARRSPQLLLISTAHSYTTSLMLMRRADALGQLNAPQDTLMMEWSAPADAVPGMPAAAAASPAWSPTRERIVSARLRRAARGDTDPDDPAVDPLNAFRAQYLNVWPQTDEGVSGWLSLAGLRDDSGPLLSGPVVGAVEAWKDSRAVVIGWRDAKGILHVRASAAGSLAEAVAQLSAANPATVLMHQATRAELAAVPPWPVVTITAAEAVSATRGMVELSKVNGWRYSGDLIEQQMPHVVVNKSGYIDQGRSPGPVTAIKAASWVLWSLNVRTAETAAVF